MTAPSSSTATEEHNTPRMRVDYYAIRSLALPDEYVKKMGLPPNPIDYEAIWNGVFPEQHSVPLKRFVHFMPR